MYATDIACIKNKSFEVKVPTFHNSYKIKKIWKDKRLWNFIILENWNENFLFAHTKSNLKVWKYIFSWEKIWNIDLSWITTWMHLHFERWKKEKWMNKNINFSWKKINDLSRKLNLQRNLKKNKKILIYMTTYNWWVVWQNDSSPCIWASGKNWCNLIKKWILPVAITSDIRKKLWIKWWQKIYLKNIKTWKKYLVQVEDEMNIRYRKNCKKRKWYCIKWDFGISKYSKQRFDGVYEIILI